MSVNLELALDDESATLALGARLARALRPGLKIYLHGELGAGKTTLVRGVLRGLDMKGRVKSPTYALVELYKLSKLDLYHFDLYRFKDQREWLDAGLRDLFEEAAVMMVEWPERAAQFLPPADVDITLTSSGDSRRVTLSSVREPGAAVVRALIGEGRGA